MLKRTRPNRASRLRSEAAYRRLNAELAQEAYIRNWYPKTNPADCQHTLSFCPNIEQGDMTRVCEDCGVGLDASHQNITDAGVSGASNGFLKSLQEVHRLRRLVHHIGLIVQDDNCDSFDNCQSVQELLDAYREQSK